MHLPNPHLMGTAGIYLERLWMAWGRGAETLGAGWEGMNDGKGSWSLEVHASPS